MFEFNTVEEAVEDLKAGKIILVTDDEDRENAVSYTHLPSPRDTR